MKTPNKRGKRINGVIVPPDQVVIIQTNAAKEVIDLIAHKGYGVNKAIKTIDNIDIHAFYKLIDNDASLLQQYTRALEYKADVIAERITKVSHNRNNDFYTDSEGNVKPNPVAVQRDRLIMDADKWLLSKIAPKKYGDKVTIDGELKGLQPLTIEQINVMLNQLKE
jgi:hypothetical protein